MATDDVEARKQRKEEAKRIKRQRIEEAGGVRPRSKKVSKHGDDNGGANMMMSKGKVSSPSNSNNFADRRFQNNKKPFSPTGHRFGRVMETVPCRNRPRFSTLSIALPGSVLSNCQTKELRTLLAGQIARACTIYHVDEIIVFDDKLGRDHRNSSWHQGGGAWRRKREHDKRPGHEEEAENSNKNNEENNTKNETEEKTEMSRPPRSSNEAFMARLLQYCECPQYLRRQFFPMHPDLQFAGLLAPIDAPHHVRGEDHSKYREGVVMPKTKDDCSLVNCGIRNRPVQIDRKLTPGIRCTVKINPEAYRKTEHIKGTVVSPSAPREDDGTYWGYTTRMAGSINEVFDGCPFEAGYDLKIGTSERGDKSVEEKNFHLPKYDHSLIVFGGVAGIEECVDADESIQLPGSQSKKLFDMWLNTCPYQASRTIRTEEAVLISLATLSPPLAKSARSAKELLQKQEEAIVPQVEFSDGSPSDESSDSDSGSSSGSDDDDEKHQSDKS